MSHLFTLIRTDVEKSAIPTGRGEIPEGIAEGFAASEDSAPTYPKSLFLLLPLFDSYELNPVGYKAQERVSLPEGLDLDAPIVDPALMEEKSNGFDAESDDQDEPDMDASENMAALQAAMKASEGSAKPKKASKGPRVKPDGTPESKEERAAVSHADPMFEKNQNAHPVSIDLVSSGVGQERRDRLETRIISLLRTTWMT
jgi:AP-3 complex subunit delta-1